MDRPSWPVEVERAAILRRLDTGDVRVLALWAPAGYGKSTLAQQFARRYETVITIDLADATSLVEIARRIVRSLTPRSLGKSTITLAEDAAAWVSYASQVWGEAGTDVAVLENAEAIAAVDGAEPALADILARTPRARTVVVSSRVPLALRFSRFALPHEIYTFDEGDLAFDVAETRRLLESGANEAQAVHELTRGWPLCVRMILRLARESTLGDVISNVAALDLESLYEYLIEHIVATFDTTTHAALVALAAIPQPTHADLELLFGERASDLRRRALTGALVAFRDGVYELHPLIRNSVQGKYKSEIRSTLRTAAERWKTTDPVRAALLYLEAGDAADAADSVEPQNLNFLSPTQSFDFNSVLQRLPRDVVLAHPQLWSASMLFRGLAVSPEERRREALHVWDSLGPATPRSVRLSVLSELLNALSNLGHHEDVQAYYDRYLTDDLEDQMVRMYRGIWGIALAGRQGRYSEAKVHLDDIRDNAKSVPGTYAIVTCEGDVRRHRAYGSYHEERISLDIAVRYARESNNANSIALALIEGIFGAWFAGDRVRFNALLQELDDFRVPIVAPGTTLFRNCAFGKLDELHDGNERPQIRAYAYLVALGSAPRVLRKSFAERAIVAADAARETILQVFSRVAMAMADPVDRSIYLDEALTYALRIDALPVREAVCALMEGAIPPYFSAMASLLLEGAADPQSFRLDLGERVLYRGMRPVLLTKRETELLCYLALQQQSVSIDTLADAMVPEKDSSSASQLLRVLVGRVRKKCGTDIVESSRAGYRLGSHLDVPYRSILRRVEAAEPQAQLAAAELAELRRDLGEVRRWMQAPAPAWEWAVDMERSLRELSRRIVERLKHESAAGVHEIDADEIAG